MREKWSKNDVEVAVRAPLEPPHDELAKVGGFGVAAAEAADVGGPVDDAGHDHVEAGLELLVEVVPEDEKWP